MILCMIRARLTLMALLSTCLANHAVGFTNQIGRDVLEVGKVVQPAMTEVSGIVASRQHPGTFWIHTDGGKQSALVAIDRDGQTLGKFDVGGQFKDWEDIAIDDQGHLYLADIGNNDAERTELRVHRVAEPDPKAKAKKGKLKSDQTWRLRFPVAPFDCESLFIVGTNGFVISKVFENAQARIYRFPLTPSKEPVSLVEVSVLPITSPVTGADVSPDGTRLGIVAKNGAYVFQIDGDPANAGRRGRFHTPFANQKVEGCTFVADGLLATAETRSIYVFTHPAFRGAPRP